MKLRGFTDYSKYFNDAKTALKKRKKSTDYRGLNTKHNYSSFWMDDRWDNASKFSGLSEHASSTSDTVKLIKLSNYRRAITNFVKIVAKQDVPVLWAGSESYTNGKAITLSADIKDSNFDVTVGLALHEASHIILTEFDILKEISEGKNELYNQLNARYPGYEYSLSILFKDLLNWIEDRRIDHYIFSTSPGYKAYYHKLYDTYWNSKDVLKGFLSSDFRDPSVIDNYLFHIINMMNPSFEPKAMPGLSEIVSVVDLRNISRLKSTREAAKVAYDVCVIIMDQKLKADEEKAAQPQSQSGDDEDENQKQNGSSQGAPSLQAQSGDDNGDNENGDGGDDSGEDVNDDNNDAPEMTELTASERNAIKKALEEQRKFLSGSVKKKTSTKKMQRELDAIANQSIDVQTVGDNSVGTRNVLMYDYVAGNKLQEYRDLCSKRDELEQQRRPLHWGDEDYMKISKQLDELCRKIEETGVGRNFGRTVRDEYKQAIRDGIDMGGLLGKKLQLHNESRERVDTRLRSGKIDAKRLAHAGYGIEGIFKQIHVDKYKKANLHITLDGSGSMNGPKWTNTIQMTMAIAKAATYTQNINIQVSIRITEGIGRGDTPTNLSVYDSRKNKLAHLIAVFEIFSPSSMTPEGLCFEAMIKKNHFVESSSEVDSYLLNISDGEPGCTSYNGQSAIEHTRRQIEYIRNVLNISVLSFFIDHTNLKEGESQEMAYSKLVERFNGYGSGKNFRRMYGKDASVVDSSSAIQIAKELNKKFLTKA